MYSERCVLVKLISKIVGNTSPFEAILDDVSM